MNRFGVGFTLTFFHSEIDNTFFFTLNAIENGYATEKNKNVTFPLLHTKKSKLPGFTMMPKHHILFHIPSDNTNSQDQFSTTI